MKKRLSKALAAAGIASRRECEEIIFEGRVTVNKETVLLPQTLVDLESDRVEVDGKRIAKEERKMYFLLNKPAGYLCTNADEVVPGKRVLDLFRDIPYRLFTVGRLDKETTGLILVTNDGHFAQKVIHPSFGIKKEYLAKTAQEITPEHLKVLSEGAWVEGCFVKPHKVTKVRRGTLKIIVGEGKKREVREMLAQAGLEVRELSRIRLGSLTLNTLPIGARRELTQSEIDSFLDKAKS